MRRWYHLSYAEQAHDQDTEAAFRFATSKIARNFARRTSALGATSNRWIDSPNTVTVTIR